MFNLYQEARQLLTESNQAAMSNTAYDTAWVARVPGSDGSSSAFPEALDWLRQNQYADGSWGSVVESYHDRIISTMAAIIALAERGDRPRDAEIIRQGESYAHRNVQFLRTEPETETVGFELILPTLLDKARQLDLDLPYNACSPYYAIREEKLQNIPQQMRYSRAVTTTHSLEFMGDELDVAQIADLQEKDGSFGNSPSATAYFLIECQDDPAARRYLTEVMEIGDGKAMSAHPVEIFDMGWVLYNLDLAGLLVGLEQEAHVHLDAMYQAWDERWGIGFSHQYAVPDLDDTAVVFKLLRQMGYDVAPNVFDSYERDAHFVCYLYERTPSAGVHMHLLDALHACPEYDHQPRMVTKILRFLHRSRRQHAYWFDKWHISPLYATSHAVIAATGYDDELVRDAVRWIIDNQRKDGSWGYYCPTSEETAYCLQALVTYHRQVELLDKTILSRAAQYLYNNYYSQEHPALWVEKGLYTPPRIVRSAIVGALWMYESL